MRLALVSFSHKKAPLEVREVLALLPSPTVYEGLRSEGLRQAVVLSTCNRFELYLSAEGLAPEEAAARGLSLLERLSGLSLSPYAVLQSGSKAVRRLFEVASGLDSLVVGETEILGQVKAAYEAARVLGMTGKYSNVLFQRALYTGKRVRSETGIAAGQTSVAAVAVELARSIFGDLKASEVLVLGAGAMAELCARHLAARKVSRLLIANRTWERALALCGKFKAEALPWEGFAQALSRVDIVVASTGSERPVLTREEVARALPRRGGRSLFLIDIALPRDVEESVHGLEHVYLYRLEDLQAIVARNLEGRAGEVEQARTMAREKAEEFCAWEGSLEGDREMSFKHSCRPVLVSRGAEEAMG